MDTRQIIVSTLTVGVFAGIAVNGHAESVSGSTSGSYTTQQPVLITGADGNMLLSSEYHGKNKSTSSNGFMDGASVTNQEIAQLTQGNGLQAGYFTQVNDEGSAIAKWDGRVTTVMKDGHPITTFKGKWDWTAGTGKYAGIKGSGDYNGYFTSQDSYVVDWKGNYSLGK